ncbi:MAG: hypothetical protein SGPRY_013469, partial [Prymnesium sp.]
MKVECRRSCRFCVGSDRPPKQVGSTRQVTSSLSCSVDFYFPATHCLSSLLPPSALQAEATSKHRAVGKVPVRAKPADGAPLLTST